MLITLLAVVLACLVAYFVVSALIANGMAMSARVPIDKTPASLGLPYQDVSFRSRVDGVLLKGWYIPAGGNETIVVMHGGKQSRGDATMQLLELCGDLARKGFNILTFDRRGCGLSEVSRYNARARFERDFGGAVDYIRSRNGSGEKVFLLGVSVGAVAALVFANQKEGISGIVSDSCFTGSYEMGKRVIKQKARVFGIFARGAVWMAKVLCGLEQDGAIDRVGFVACPILFISGAEDEVVPAGDTYQLCQASNNPLDEVWVAPGAKHSQAYSTNPAEYVRKVTDFLAGKCRAFPPEPPPSVNQ